MNSGGGESVCNLRTRTKGTVIRETPIVGFKSLESPTVPSGQTNLFHRMYTESQLDHHRLGNR